MKIRTQNLLTIVPLFLFLATVSCILLYNAERRELLWGLQEEASSLVTAAAEFIDANEFQNFVTQGTRSPYYAQLRVPLDRILKYDQAKRIFALTPDGSKVAFDLHAPYNATATEASDELGNNIAEFRDKEPAPLPNPLTAYPQLEKTLQKGTDFVSQIESAAQKPLPKPAHLTAFAPIRDRSGRVAGILGVETDATSFTLALSQVANRIVYIVGIVFLLGVLAALYISRLVTREVRDLQEAAMEVKEGNLERQIQSGSIQEVADLGNTFNTMSDVLKDTLLKTRRSLAEGEQFRTDDDLAQAYIELFWLPLQMTLGNVRVVAQQIGKLPVGNFYGAFEARGQNYALVGQVKETEALDTAITASAAFSLIRQELQKREPESVFETVKTLFDFERVECYCWDPAAATVEKGSLSGSGALLRETLPLPPGKTVAVHTFSEATRSLVERYLGFFEESLSPEALLSDLVALLPAEEQGSLLLLQKQTDEDRQASSSGARRGKQS
jgi:HAMP domain-containing protein